MRTGDGLVYLFGIIYDSNGNPYPEKVALARYEPGDGCHEYPTQVWKWGLLEIRDSFGNKIEYKYHLERKGDYDDRVCNNHIDIYPTEIDYGNFKVLFNVEPRQDYRAAWEGKHSGILHSKVRLKSIDLMVGDQRVKSYLFTYWADTDLENVIMPNFKWQGEARTSTLASVQEVVDRNVSLVQGYQPTKFYYSSPTGELEFNNLHLMRVENGYGGVISFEYAPYYHELSIDDPRKKTYYLVKDPCDGGVCTEVNSQGWEALPGGGLSRRNTRYHTPPGSTRSTLVLTPNGNTPTFMHVSFPEAFLKSGTKIRFEHEVKLSDRNVNDAYASFGYRLTSSNDPSTVRSSVINNLPYNEWAFGDDDLDDLFIPGTYNLNEIELFFEVSNTTRIGNLRLQPLIVRFAAVNKTVTDTVGQTSASWAYQYPEPLRMNDNEGSGWYLPKNTEFWGFPRVEITQTDHVTGTSFVTIQEYEVSREKKGLLTSQTVRIGSDCYASSHYIYETQTLYNPGQLANTNLWGYADLKVAWNQLLESTDYSYDGLSCADIDNATTARLGNRSTYTYLDNATANNNRNLNPTSMQRDFFDGSAWKTQSIQYWSYKGKKSYGIGGLTFEFNNLLDNQYLNHPTIGELQQTYYTYNETDWSLIKVREWVDSIGTVKQYAVTAFSWDAKGRLASKQTWQTPVQLNAQPTGTNLTATYLYEDQNFPKLVTNETLTGSDGLSFTTLTSYNQLGLPVMVTHPDGSNESAAYDGLGRIIGVCGRGFNCAPDTYTMTAEYHMESASSPSVTVCHDSGSPVRYTYDGFGQLTKKTLLWYELNGALTEWDEQVLSYTGLGQILRETNAGLTRQTSYDNLGRVASISRVEGGSSVQEALYAYQLVDVSSGVRNWQKTTTDANGNSTSEYTNALGLVVKLEPPLNTGPSVIFSYDAIGRLLKTNYGGAESEITYNTAGNKTSMIDADMGEWQYFYNADGSLRAQIDANQNKTCLEYDSIGRLKSKSFGDAATYCDTLNQNPTIIYNYDELEMTGYRTSMTDPSGSTQWVYDARGRVVREKKTILGDIFLTDWAYNNADQLTSMIYPSGERINYTYLPQGTLASVGNYQTGTLVDAQNRVVEVSFANGITTNYTYNDWLNGAGRLLSKQSQNQNTGEIYQYQTHSYDPVGNVTKITDGTNQWQEQTFSYDALNRLLSAQTSAVGEGQYSQTYGYDPATGNLNYRSDVGNYVYDPYKPHAVTSAGANIYAYDLSGNMITRGTSDEPWDYQYDAENRLVQIDRDGLEVNRYLYDGDGNRVAKLGPDDTGTIFIGNYFEAVYPHYSIPDPLPPVTEGSGGDNDPNAPNPIPQGDITYYYAGSQRIAMRDANGVYFLLSDHLGSSSVVVNQAGIVEKRAYYLPWGGNRGGSVTITDYGYTGQMREGDIYYYGARWYDPAIGRFMQADTVVPMASQGTQAFDRYAYVNNNPLRYTDPSGHWMCGDQYDLSCAESNSEIMRFGQMYMKTTGLPYNYVLSGSYDFGLGKSTPINRYNDDVISPAVPSGHPVADALQFIDLAVRFLDEFKPLQKHVAKDDFYWLVSVTASENEMEITRMSFWVPGETIAKRTIDFRTPDLVGRGQLSVNEVLLGPKSLSIDMNYTTSEPMILITFSITCYGCMTGSYYRDSFTPSVLSSPKIYIPQMPQ